MIVLDASTVIELLLSTARGRWVAERLADPNTGLHAPHLIDVEVAQVLRRLVQQRELRPATALDALEELRGLDLERHSHEPLLGRVWTLRENLTAYDAVYVALAEGLEATLLTCDARLAHAPAARRFVELVPDVG